jgi:regulator of sirC expression with transglutaminase-like and TPR domain
MNTPKASTEEVFSAKEKEEIIARIFLQKKIGSSFLFKGNGGEYYDKILHSK